MNFYIIAEGDFDKNKNKNYTRTIQINEKKKNYKEGIATIFELKKTIQKIMKKLKRL